MAIKTLAGEWTPRVGDEIEHALDSRPHPRRFLAIRIGLDDNNPGSELWWAWDEQKGTLATVSVGKYWRLRNVFDESKLQKRELPKWRQFFSNLLPPKD